MLESLAKGLAKFYSIYPFRGYGRLNNFISSVFGEKATVIEVHGFKFAFDIFDPYWNRLLDSKYTYEPEVEAFLRRHFDNRPIFVDC